MKKKTKKEWFFVDIEWWDGCAGLSDTMAVYLTENKLVEKFSACKGRYNLSSALVNNLTGQGEQKNMPDLEKAILLSFAKNQGLDISDISVGPTCGGGSMFVKKGR